MENLHFHCQNCNASDDILNITHIEELKEHINSNLVTIISHNTDCDNCVKTINELKSISDYKILSAYFNSMICNIKLVETHGYMLYNGGIGYYKFTINATWSRLSEEEFFDSIKEGSLLCIHISKDYLINKLNKKCHNFYLIPIAHCPKHYRVEKFTMTKPALK